MKPGYTVAYPIDSADDAGNPVFGSFAIVNSWPRKTSEAKAVYVDQFSAKTLAVDKQYGYGGTAVVSDTLVSTHMGTEFGVFDRILMTLVCVTVIWSVISAIVMYGKRRRSGLGFPRRPVDVKVANGMLAIAVVAIVYPLWGVTAIIVLLLDRFVVRKVVRCAGPSGSAETHRSLACPDPQRPGSSSPRSVLWSPPHQPRRGRPHPRSVGRGRAPRHPAR